jgi:transposase InsO family protein
LKNNYSVSERRACRAINQPRSTQRHKFAEPLPDSILIRSRVIELAKKYGRYGYRRIWALLKTEGFHVNAKRIYRIWRQEGLKVPSKQPKKARLWLNDGSCIRLRPEYRNHVWSYDFVEDKTHDGRKIRMFNVIDEYTRECIAIRVRRKLNSTDVLAVLSKLFIQRGLPDYVRSDNGSEFVAKKVRKWFFDTQVKTLYIEPGSPWENGYCESFNGKLQDELLKGEIFYTLKEAQVLIERWRIEYNTIRPHSSLGYRPPAPESFLTNQRNVDFKYVS